MMKAIIFDADGMAIDKSGRFSKRFAREYNSVRLLRFTSFRSQ